MKNKFLFGGIAAVVAAMAMNACSDNESELTKEVASEKIVVPTIWIGATSQADCATKAGSVYSLTTAAELNWTSPASTAVYCLCGDVRVPASSTLNISAGVLVRGFKGTNASLTVLPGAKINAVGTQANPIIFTSTATAGSRAPQDWGGVIILGNAQVNTPGAPIKAEGYEPLTPAPLYGSNTSANNTENSGTFQYVRIEFGGVPTSTPNSEKNGLTLGGVGSGTVIDHVQVSSGADDGFEWFGGTVNAKYLISHKNLDDDFDTDLGFTGKVQYGVVSRDPAGADVSKSNGFESDNDAAGSANTPKTAPIFSNFTIIGPIQCSLTGVNANYQDGLHIRRASELDIYNSVVVGWARNQGFADGTIASVGFTSSHLTAVSPSVVTTAVYQPTALWTAAVTNTSATAVNCTATDPTSIYRLSGLQTSAWTLTNVNFTPLTAIGYTSPILATGTNATAINAFFSANTTTSTATTYFRGARRVADDNGWNLTSGWVNWQPETAPYNNDGVY